MKVNDGIEMLEITINIMGRENKIYPALMWDKSNVILVDAGYPNQASEFNKALKEFDMSLDDISKIILTHHDIDHIGGLADILKESKTAPETLSHEIEKEYISGKARAVKLAQMEANPEALPEQMKPFFQGMKNFYDNCRIVISKTISDEEELPYCGGITVVFTPGHTPGHICLYHKLSRTLIAGDALSIENGQLVPSPARINFNQTSYIESLKKLSQYEIDAVICYHGGLYRGNASRQIEALIPKLL